MKFYFQDLRFAKFKEKKEEKLSKAKIILEF